MGAYLSSPVTEKELFEGDGVSMHYGGSSMQGWRRTMEDAHVAETALPEDPETAIFGVFDGHGGAEVAKFCQKYLIAEFQRLKASSSVDEALIKCFHRMDDMLRDTSRFHDELEHMKTKEPTEEDGDDDRANGTMDALDLLKRVFQLKRFMGGDNSANAAGANGAAGGGASGAFKIDESAEPEDNLPQAGCTAVVAVKCGDELFVANAGDSRGVLCRNGRALALSEDHKPAQEGERSRIIAAGGFLSEIGGVCRVNGNLNLSRAIGDLKYKGNTELPASQQIITAQPDICKISLTSEDRFFVLACDGVWDVMSNQDVVDFISHRLDQGMTPSQASSALLDACLANDPKEARGVGCDNMTSVVVQLKHTLPKQAQLKAAE
mmetsp:Transcript_4471/g.7470  ORF Transcript_4471/g.7470 Transcript_4471/m.7470 type:complete len:379 (+) Transcript_4471:202-1338(+)|eukprot:CAMPEP_0119102982 /NCGR_PEP_ID=MMETSP1180-20130426/1549_1 /TAXON_ID=3052 ORGANISM="Chlamydomonas cf sp, Strain CCMP681" /NCGR_SAMPLE_ID=MMETSP1180 /ASSEMBLY_ACC=CAM_ASM_000741 /LENGTH=378 /DNA_ID=CAMNT_0007087383 /DNA_START=195 /DNA_END=1331 /DNA_ORIENTATION=+